MTFDLSTSREKRTLWLTRFPAVFSKNIVLRCFRYKLWQPVITPEQYEGLGRCHNSTVGHHGVERTVKKAKAAGITWPYLRELVRIFICSCPCCQKMSYIKIPINARRFTTTAAGPMEVLNIDYYEGPFPEDEYGNMYVLTIIDTFSRAIGLYAVRL